MSLNIKNIFLKPKQDKKYLDGYLVVLEEDIGRMDPISEGELFVLKTDFNQPLGLFYYGKQNKGVGFKISDDIETHLDRDFFIKLFTTAKEERESLFNATHTNAFRLYNGEGDGLGGFTIDHYDGHLLIQWYSEGIYSYKQDVYAAIKNVFDYTSIYEKLRFTKPLVTNEVTDVNVEFPIVIKENDLFFTIHLNDGPMTGIFLDQRDVRKKLTKLDVQGRMMNLFAYSGGFSVASSMVGMHTTSVDIAKRSLELIEQNFGLNGMNIEEHDMYTLDVFDMLKYCKRHGLMYDVMVIDPPSFARSKKRRFSVKEHYNELIDQALPLMNRGGYLVLSTNASDYPLHKFKKMINQTIAPSGRDFQIVDVLGLPKDFKTTDKYKPSKYLKVVFVKILD